VAVTEIQSVAAVSGGTSNTHPTVTLAATPATGNLLVAFVNVRITAGDVTVTMPGDWTPVQQKLSVTSTSRQAVFYKTAAVSEPTVAQATLTAARQWVMFVVEAHSTTSGGWALDKSASNAASGASPTTGTTATTVSADEYLAAGICAITSVTLATPTNSFAITQQQVEGGTLSAAMLTRVVAAVGAYSTGATYSGGSAGYAATIQTFRVATSTVTAGGAALTGTGSLEARGTYATPTLFFGAAFGYTSTDEYPVWTDISSYGQGFTWQRGRQNELNQIQAGTATLTLNDPRSYFDPDNTASPFYPNVKPGLPVRAILFVGSSMYPLFHGFAERLPRTERVTNVHTRRQIDLTDGLALLAYAGLGGDAYPVQTSDQRVTAVLDNIGWPSTRRVIGTGSETLQDVAYPAEDTTTALTHLQALDASEDGLLYVDASNNVVFVGRAALASPPYTVASATFKDTA
jgi:hypothetical protein